jgi:hypothetical protein
VISSFNLNGIGCSGTYLQFQLLRRLLQDLELKSSLDNIAILSKDKRIIFMDYLRLLESMATKK